VHGNGYRCVYGAGRRGNVYKAIPELYAPCLPYMAAYFMAAGGFAGKSVRLAARVCHCQRRTHACVKHARGSMKEAS
jgi:hypothetical protein